MGRHVFQHHAARPHLRPFTDLDVAKKLGAGADEDAAPDLRVAIAGVLAGAAEGDLVQQRHVVLDDRRFADHHAGGVVDQDAFPDPRRGVNIDAEHLRAAALEIQGERRAAVVPQPVGDPVGLQRMKTLEIEKRFRVGLRRRVPLPHGADVGAHGLADLLVGVHGVGDEFPHQHRGQHRALEFRRELKGQRVFQRLVIQDRRVKEACQYGLARRRVTDFLADRLPQGVDRRLGEFGRVRFRHGLECSCFGSDAPRPD